MRNTIVGCVGVVAAVCLIASSASADSLVYQPVAPFHAEDISAGYPSAFDVTGTGEILALHGMSVDLLSPGGVFERTVGTVPTYNVQSAYGSFVRLSPDGSQVWVGFTVGFNNVDDRIYSMPFSGGAATYQATLSGNLDLEFGKVGSTRVPFVSGTNSADYNNSVWLLNTSGGTSTKIASVGGYGAGLAFDSQGNLYVLSQSNLKLYEFSHASVEKVAGGLAGVMTADNAIFSTSTAFAGYNVTVDGADRVFFNGNDPFYSGQSIVCMLEPGYSGQYKYDNIATGLLGFQWGSQMAVGDGTGGVLEGNSILYVGDWYGPGVTAFSVAPEPASLLLVSTGVVALGAAIRRRRAQK